MSLVSAADLMRGLKVLEGRITWLKCPFCDDEYTKLRKCVYYQDSKPLDSSVCVECAESVKGLTFLAHHYPVLGVDVERELFPVYKRLHPKYISEYSYKANVKYSDGVSYMVWPKGGRLAVLKNGQSPDEEKSYDNTFQVWFALRQELNDGEKTELDQTPKFKRKTWAK